MPKTALRALLLTVGTGDVNNPQDTLFTPLTISMRKDRWDEILLLPSRLTVRNAGLLEKALADLPLSVRPLRQKGDENNVDACFAHFDAAMTSLRVRGFQPEHMCADFTRGTKAMSAALTIAAMRHGLARLRYITGTRDERGLVQPGTESIRETSPVSVAHAKALDAALLLAQRGAWQAAIDVLPVFSGPFSELTTAQIRDQATKARAIASFHLAWDRLDYGLAALLAKELPRQAPPGWGSFLPRKPLRRWIAELAQPMPLPLEKQQYLRAAERLRMLAADLWTNGERRLREGMFEDAALRAYRVLELLCQIRLFLQGYDAAHIPPMDPAVQQAEAAFKMKRKAGFTPNPAGAGFNADANVGARFLQHLGDPMAGKLIKAGEQAYGIPADLRNRSLLIRGFQPLGGNDRARLESAFATLRGLLEQDDPKGARRRFGTIQRDGPAPVR